MAVEEDAVPVFDFARLTESLESDAEVARQLRDCCDRWGCFRVINCGVEEGLLQKVDESCREAFSLPIETKRRNGCSSGAKYAYIGGVPEVPYYESLALNLQTDSPLSFSQLMWPGSGNAKFCEVMEEYIERMKEMIRTTLQMVLFGVGIKRYSEEIMQKCRFELRMNHYESPPSDSSEEKKEELGLGAHTDLGVLGILLEDTVGGLQVLQRSSKRWIDIQPIKGSLIVFLGDSLKAWCNGRVHNAKHRVMVREGKSRRLSVGVFAVPDDAVEISAVDDLLRSDPGSLRFKKFRYSEYVDFMSVQYGQGLKSSELDNLDLFASVSLVSSSSC
eukprot:TRINITY_DN18227_c0_g1_i3.p1 TRINITY_DN18227_c0_g1~~TRINITY_DN18227_c0_g1_i3.p1  ORF type:complete len:332 (-),score=7.28 TRINITY_DN18227_c0_g1_i3:212-1207(-)